MLEKVYQDEAGDQDWLVRGRDHWPVLILAVGFLLTLAWNGLLIWGAYVGLAWLLG